MYKIDKESLQEAKRIIKVMEDNGYIASIKEALEAWGNVSSSLCAGWLCLNCYTNDEIFELILSNGYISITDIF